jgi:hypothetical protein
MNQDNQAGRDRGLYESRAAELVGRRVLEVAYWDVHNFADEPRTWDYGDWHHAVMGVDLLTDGGPSCVLWTDTFFAYGVEVFPTTPAADHIVATAVLTPKYAAATEAASSSLVANPVAAGRVLPAV